MIFCQTAGSHTHRKKAISTPFHFYVVVRSYLQVCLWGHI